VVVVSVLVVAEETVLVLVTVVEVDTVTVDASTGALVMVVCTVVMDVCPH